MKNAAPADIIVANPDRSCANELWFPQPHLNIRKKTIGDGFVDLELEPAGDMGDEHQHLHYIRISDAFVANFASLEWAARYALMEGVLIEYRRRAGVVEAEQ